jgi:hypothetical protein
LVSAASQLAFASARISAEDFAVFWATVTVVFGLEELGAFGLVVVVGAMVVVVVIAVGATVVEVVVVVGAMVVVVAGVDELLVHAANAKKPTKNMAVDFECFMRILNHLGLVY